MIDRKHNVILNVNGEDVGFRFTTWALKQTITRCGLKGVTELYSSLGSNDIDTWIALILEARREFIYSETKKEVEISMRDAAELIDSVGGLMTVMNEMASAVQGHTPKNQPAPQMEGQQSSQ